MPTGLNQKYSGATDAAGAAARRTGSLYESRLTAFDPMAFMREGAAAGMDAIGEGYAETEAMRRRSLNRRGLGGSDFGGGAATRDLNSRVAREIAGRSQVAAGMQMDVNSELGAQSRYQNDSYLDLLTGAMDREEAQKNAKRSRWKSLAGGLGALAGGLVAGPAGASVGASLGSGIGDFIG